MATVFLHALRRFRGAIIGWGIALALFGLLLVPLYNDLVVEQGDALLALMEAYPEEIQAFIGGFEQFNTPQGFLNIEFFSYMPLIVGILAISAGAGLLVGDEEQGILDLALAHPVSRSALFFGRLLAMVLTFVLIMAISWAGMAIPSGDLPGLSAGDIALSYISLLSTMLLFATMALLLSLLLPSRRLALAVTGLFMVASFFIKGLAALSESLDATAKFF